MALIHHYSESSLTTSEVWDGINNMDPKETVLNKAINLIKTSKHLTSEDIEAGYIAVKQITDTLTRAALRAFDTQKTILVYNNVPSMTITQAVPFLTLKTPKGYVTYVFVDKYITVSRDGVLSIQPTILRDLLIGAVVANGLKNNYQNLVNNEYLQKICMEMYTKFFTRIINRQFSIMPDKAVFESVQYWVNRFFLEMVFSSADLPENVDKISKDHIKYLDEMSITEITNRYNTNPPKNVSELLEIIKTASPRMNSLGLGMFLNDWINYYYYPATLAIDNIEYFLFMCLTLLSGNNLVNISASDIVKEAKFIKSFRGEILKLVV